MSRGVQLHQGPEKEVSAGLDEAQADEAQTLGRQAKKLDLQRRDPPDTHELPILQGILMGSSMGMGVPLLEAPGISLEFRIGNIRKMENLLST